MLYRLADGPFKVFSGVPRVPRLPSGTIDKPTGIWYTDSVYFCADPARDLAEGAHHMNIKSENNKLRGILLDAMGKHPMTRDELLTYTAELYCEDGTEHTPAETEELTHIVRSLAGTVLGALLREKKVVRDANGRYSPATETNETTAALRASANAKKAAPTGKSAAGGNAGNRITGGHPDDGAEGEKGNGNNSRSGNAGDKSGTTGQVRRKTAGQANGQKVRGKAEITARTKAVPDRSAKDCTDTGRSRAEATRKGQPDREALESEILQILAKKPLRRGELFRRLDESVGVSKDSDAAETLHRTAEDVLKELKRKKAVGCSFGVYRPAPISKITEKTDREPAGTSAKSGKSVQSGGDHRKKQMRRVLSADDSDKLRRHFLVRLYARGGAYLEQYAMNLLIKYYQDSGKVIRGSQVTGGSTDGGIDGVLEITDWLGFRECIMIQTKCRGSIQVTEKEIREFYGVVCSRNGSRGIFITTSTFHDSAKKLLAAIDNCVGVDGEKLFLMACRCHYGIREGTRGDEIDPEII